MLATVLYFIAFTSFRLIAIKPWVSAVSSQPSARVALVSEYRGECVALVSEYGGEAGAGPGWG